MTLMDEADKARVQAAIAEIERVSGAEVVVAVGRRSDDYGAVRGLLSLCLGIVLANGALYGWPAMPAWGALLTVFAASAAGFILLGHAQFWWRFVPQPLRAEAVHRRAMQTFTERGIYRTRDGTGILILLSVFERQAVILGDAAIHQRIGEGGWQEYVQAITTAVKEGRAAAGIIDVLEGLEPILKDLAPRREDDSNELADEVVELDR